MAVFLLFAALFVIAGTLLTGMVDLHRISSAKVEAKGALQAACRAAARAIDPSVWTSSSEPSLPPAAATVFVDVLRTNLGLDESLTPPQDSWITGQLTVTHLQIYNASPMSPMTDAETGETFTTPGVAAVIKIPMDLGIYGAFVSEQAIFVRATSATIR